MINTRYNKTKDLIKQFCNKKYTNDSVGNMCGKNSQITNTMRTNTLLEINSVEGKDEVSAAG